MSPFLIRVRKSFTASLTMALLPFTTMAMIGATYTSLTMHGLPAALTRLSFAATDELGNVSTSMRPKNVIVIGAGLAGLAVSLGLANAGFTVDLVEKKREFAEGGATFGLRPNGQKALEELLGNQTPSCATLMQTLRDHSLPTPQGGWMLPWGTVRNALLHAVQAQSKHITLHMGLNLSRIDDEPSAPLVRAIFSATNDSTFITNQNDIENIDSVVLKGCMVLGCDGVGSAVRTAHLRLPPAAWTGVSCWRGRVSVPLSPHADLITKTGSSSLLKPLLQQGIVPLGMRTYGPCTLMAFNFHDAIPGCLAWTGTVKQDVNALGSKNGPAMIAQGTSLWSIVEPHIETAEERAMIYELLHLSDPADVSRVVQLRTIDPSNVSIASTTTAEGDDDASAWPRRVRVGWGGRGRVTLLGDAAHAMRPATGVGGALAFEDCAVLCRHLHSVQ